MANFVELYKNIKESFELHELKISCGVLNIKWDEIKGDTLPEKALELIEYMDRRKRIGDLLCQLQKDRPHVKWSSLVDLTGDASIGNVNIAAELKGFLNAIGYEIVDEVLGDRYVIFQTQLVLPGEYLKRWLFCKNSGVTLNDVKLLKERVSVLSGSKGWIITEANIIEPDAQHYLADHSDIITAHTLGRFYRQVLQCDSYLQKELIDGAVEIEKYWVNLECKVSGEGRFDLVEYVDNWLKTTYAHELILLGDFGTGKTWFCRYYAARLARLYLDNPDENRIPVLISLREYTTALKIEQLITSTLVDGYNIMLPGGFRTFMHLNKWGRLLLIFDGFDEMSQHIKYSLAQRNYQELTRTATDSGKTLLTSRPLFFEGEQHFESVLKSSDNQPRFETLSLWEFSDQQIQELLCKQIPEKWEKSWMRISQFSRLKDLASRPVMTHIIAETLPDIDDPDQIDSAELYQIYLSKWIEEACRFELDHVENVKEDVLTIVRDLACELFDNQVTKTISLSTLREQTQGREDADQFELILRRLFVHDKQTRNYTFPHVSFIEYFVADATIKDLREGQGLLLLKVSPTSGVLGFLADMLRDEPDLQQKLLIVLLEIETSEQTTNLVALLTHLDEKKWHGSRYKEGEGNPVRPIVDILKMQKTKGFDVSLRLSQHVIAMLGKEKFLNALELLAFPSPVRHFLLELWGNPAIEVNRALEVLNQVIYYDPGKDDFDKDVGLHAVRVLGQWQGKVSAQKLIEALDDQAMLPEIRQTCVESIRVKTLTKDSSHHLLNVLHKIISDKENDFDLRADCVTKLKDYDSQEALEPLIPILMDFHHVLWLASANTLHQTSVLSIAEQVEREIVLPNEDKSDLEGQVVFLKRYVKNIKNRVAKSAN